MANGDCEVLVRGIKDAHSLFRFLLFVDASTRHSDRSHSFFTPFVGIFFRFLPTECASQSQMAALELQTPA